MSYSAQSKSIHEFMLDIHNYFLPAIQREFVWSSEKTEELFDSLLRGYPIGTLLFWDVREPAIHDFQFYDLIRKYDVRNAHNVRADLSIRQQCMGILDGQQRVTSLYLGLTGSYTEKIPRLWWNNPDAYPEKKLYINLLHRPKPDDEEHRFQIKFLPETKARPSDEAYWFRIGDILMYKTRDQMRDFRRSMPHRDNETFENNLDALWTAVFENQGINYFVETSQDLDRVLRIFVRLNRGGTPLSYSDLLLSLATATWKSHDAREQVYELVEYLNHKCGPEFDFSKDFVLKALLVFSNKDVRFRTDNVNRKSQLEDIWDRAQAALKITVKLMGRFGFDRQTLSAPNAIIPIAYYVYRRKLDEGFLTQKGHEDDREGIRLWLLKMLLGRVFGGQSDRVLSSIRGVIQAATGQPSGKIRFPAHEIEDHLRATQSFSFTHEAIKTIVSETTSRQPLAFATLALLFPYLNYQHSRFDIDHMHPHAAFSKNGLEKQGLSGDDSIFALGHWDYLPNLQLLPKPVNEAKGDKPLADWLKGSQGRLYRELSLIPDVDLSLRNYGAFYEARQERLIQALTEKVGFVDKPEVVEEEAIPLDALVTGEPAGI